MLEMCKLSPRICPRSLLDSRAGDAAGAVLNVRFLTLGELGVRLREPRLIAEGRR